MSMILTCKDCGKEFIKPGNKGVAPSRCPDCRLEAKRQAARRCAEKRKALRERVKAKRLGLYVPEQLGEEVPEQNVSEQKLRTCIKCREKKPSEQFMVDGIRKRYCPECREARSTKRRQTTCIICRRVQPTDSYELTRTGRNRRRVCPDCMAKSAKRAKERERERQELAEVEAFIKELAQRRRRKRSKQATAEAEKRMDALVLAAEAQGMSYGKYQALLRQRKLKEGT